MGWSKGCAFPAEALKTWRVGPLLPTHSGTQHPCTRWERTSPDKFAHAHSFLPLVRNTGVSRLLPPTSSQPTQCAPPAQPLSLPCVSLEGPWRHHLLCVTPLWPWALSLQPQRLGRGPGKLSPSPTIHTPLPTTSIPRGKKKKSKTKTKKSFVQRYIFIIQSLYSTKKDRKKRCTFFFHYCR